MPTFIRAASLCGLQNLTNLAVKSNGGQSHATTVILPYLHGGSDTLRATGSEKDNKLDPLNIYTYCKFLHIVNKVRKTIHSSKKV